MTHQVDGPIALVSPDELEKFAARAAEMALDAARLERATDVRFGDEPHQALTADWAELVLRELYTQHRQTFADCLAGAFAEVRKAKPGPRPAQK